MKCRAFNSSSASHSLGNIRCDVALGAESPARCTGRTALMSGEILQMALSLFGGHAKRVGTHANVGFPTVRAVVTSRKVLVDDCHAEPRRFLLS